MLDQETEIQLLDRLLTRVDPSFVDVGAERGQFARWLLDRGMRGHAFEPFPAHAAALAALADARPELTFLPWAVDAGDGPRDLHIATDDTGSALDHFHSLQPLQGDTRIHHTRTLSVPCRSLGSLLAEGALPPSVGLLKVDTEGNDLRVLQGMGRFRAQILMVEYFTDGIYAGWSDAAPERLLAEATRLGYEHCLAVRRMTNGLPERVTYQPCAFQPAEWGNLIFVKGLPARELQQLIQPVVAETERRMLDTFARLQRACDERLALVETLHREAERRLQVINGLQAQIDAARPRA